MVAAIFDEGIATGDATFGTEVPSWTAWDQAHTEIRLVAELDGRIVGWSALSTYSDRCCYRGVAEVSVYVAADARGRGVGKELLEAVISRSEAAGVYPAGRDLPGEQAEPPAPPRLRLSPRRGARAARRARGGLARRAVARTA